MYVKRLSVPVILVFCLCIGAAAADDAALVMMRRPPPWWKFWGHPSKKTPAAELIYAETLRETGHIKKASGAYRVLVHRWPDSMEAAEAQYNYACLLQERGRYLDAFDEFKRLMNGYTGQYPYDDVLSRMAEIAKKVIDTRKGKFLFFPGFEAPERAIPLLEEVIRLGPNWDFAPEAQFLIGKAYDHTKDYELAVDAYGQTQYRYPTSPFAEKASFNKGYDLYRLANESPNDDQLAATAWAALTFFIRTFPNSEHIAQAKTYRTTLYKRRARMAYNKAVFYDRLAHRPKSALIEYRLFIGRYPTSAWTKEAELRIKELEEITKKDEHHENT